MIQNSKHERVDKDSNIISPDTKKQNKKDNSPEISVLNIPELLVTTNGDTYPNPEYGKALSTNKFNVDITVKR